MRTIEHLPVTHANVQSIHKSSKQIHRAWAANFTTHLLTVPSGVQIQLVFLGCRFDRLGPDAWQVPQVPGVCPSSSASSHGDEMLGTGHQVPWVPSTCLARFLRIKGASPSGSAGSLTSRSSLMALCASSFPGSRGRTHQVPQVPGVSPSGSAGSIGGWLSYASSTGSKGLTHRALQVPSRCFARFCRFRGFRGGQNHQVPRVLSRYLVRLQRFQKANPSGFADVCTGSATSAASRALWDL